MDRLSNNRPFINNKVNFKGTKELRQEGKSLGARIKQIQEDNNEVTKGQMVVGTGVAGGVVAGTRAFSKLGEDSVIKSVPKKIEIMASKLKASGKIGKFMAKMVDNPVVKKSLTGFVGAGALLVVASEIILTFTGGSKMFKNDQ